MEITVKTALGLGALAAGGARLGAAQDHALERALLTLAGLLLVFPSLIEGILEAVIGRDIRLHCDIRRGYRRRGPAKTAHATGAARSAGRQRINGKRKGEQG